MAYMYITCAVRSMSITEAKIHLWLYRPLYIMMMTYHIIEKVSLVECELTGLDTAFSKKLDSESFDRNIIHILCFTIKLNVRIQTTTELIQGKLAFCMNTETINNVWCTCNAWSQLLPQLGVNINTVSIGSTWKLNILITLGLNKVKVLSKKFKW